MRKINLLGLVMLFLLGMISGNLVAQGVPITGTVLSDDGNPLPGATVLVAGTTRATTTDNAGKFTINVAVGATLEFSYVGSRDKSVPVENRTVVNVTLTVAASKLNDVVVVGYGTVKRKDLTGSVSSISAKDLKDIPLNSAEEALAGKLA